VLVLILVSTFLICRCPRHRQGSASSSIEEAPLPPLGGAVKEMVEAPYGHPTRPSDDAGTAPGDAAALAAEVRALKAQVQRLEARAEGSTVGSETASIPRSLSTMKREQTHAVRDSEGVTLGRIR
jgi:hypothetical protein